MSGKYFKKRSQRRIAAEAWTAAQLKQEVAKVLQDKIHGLSFSPYMEGQGPGSDLTEQQIRQRLSIIQPHIDWVRTFSCTEGNELIPRIAKDEGLKTLVGVWLDDDRHNNELELANAIEIAKQGHADLLAVGNEVLLRGELQPDELIEYIERAKQAAPSVEVGYVDAYFQFVDHPQVADACDVIFANCYPYWEGYPAEHALAYMKDMYHKACKVAAGKKVIISETGWPNVGTPDRDAIPSELNAMRYFIESIRWAEEENIDMFYFAAFDEAWKVEDEGDVGAYWGLWDKDGLCKYV